MAGWQQHEEQMQQRAHSLEQDFKASIEIHFCWGCGTWKCITDYFTEQTGSLFFSMCLIFPKHDLIKKSEIPVIQLLCEIQEQVILP